MIRIKTMKRLFLLLAIITLACLLPEMFIWGQAIPSLAPAADKKPPETLQSNRAAKDESWYSIIFNGEKVGLMHTTIDEVTISAPGNAPVQKSYVFLREVDSNRPDALPYLKLSEEMQLNSSSMALQKSTLKMVLTDKRELTLRGLKDGDNIKFSTTILTPSSSGEPVSQTSNQEFAGDENIYSEQALGFLLIANKWTVNQSFPIKLISPYNPTNLFVDAHLTIKEKTSQKIMEVMTEGYLCSLMILDPASSVKEMEYFIGLNGVILKQATSNISIIKTVKEDSLIQASNKRVFERRGRVDPFVLRLTPIGGGRPKEGDDAPKNPEKIKDDKLIVAFLTEAREQLQLMKDIYEKTPEDQKDKLLVVPYQRILEIYQKVNEMKDLNAKSQMEEIRTEAERLFAGAEKIYAEAGYIRDEARKDFELKNFRELPKRLAKISELSDRKEIKNTEYYAKVKALLEEVAELARRAKIIDEFFATRPVITGIIYYIKSEEVKLQPIIFSFLGSEISLPVSYFRQIPASSIMVGSKVYNEGDKVSEDLTVKTVQPNTVVFNYKNEVIALEYKGK